MSATRLLLIRHAEVEARYQHVFGGSVDMDISPRGHDQAALLARYLRTKPFDVLYASPMKRVQQTLVPTLSNGSPQATILAGLREVDFGDWTGHGWDAVREKFGVNAYTWLDQLENGTIPNAENVATFRQRVGDSLQEILSLNPSADFQIGTNRADLEVGAPVHSVQGFKVRTWVGRNLSPNSGKTIAVFCHGGVIRMMLSILLRVPLPRTDAFQVEYTSITEVSIGPHRTRIELLNFTPWRDWKP